VRPNLDLLALQQEAAADSKVAHAVGLEVDSEVQWAAAVVAARSMFPTFVPLLHLICPLVLCNHVDSLIIATLHCRLARFEGLVPSSRYEDSRILINYPNRSILGTDITFINSP
jgi:hypothetical protein